jgi:hypothetical protein
MVFDFGKIKYGTLKGRLALPGGTLTSEFVEFEVKRALEWLQGVREFSITTDSQNLSKKQIR